MANNNTISLNIVGFNCQGIKSNLNYIDFLLKFECNILLYVNIGLTLYDPGT